MAYTYCVTHIPTGSKYYGVRTKPGCDPSDLWTTYFTSSRLVHEMIARDGLSSFMFEVRREFDDPKDAMIWEDRVLRRLKVLYRDDWLNRTIGGKLFCAPTKHTDATKAKMSAARVGRTISEATKAKHRTNNTGDTNPFYGRKHTAESIEKIKKNHRTGDQTARLDKMAGVFEITTPEGEVLVVKNLSAFCRSHGLSQGNMTNVSKGRAKQHLGYKCRRLVEFGGVFS